MKYEGKCLKPSQHPPGHSHKDTKGAMVSGPFTLPGVEAMFLGSIQHSRYWGPDYAAGEQQALQWGKDSLPGSEGFVPLQAL